MISWQRNWVVSLLLVLALAWGGAAACSRGNELPSDQQVSPEVRGVTEGWMGRFAARDEVLRQLLTANRGWGHLRDMELFEAVQYFEAGQTPADRIGAARCYLHLAELNRALDALFLEAEADYVARNGAALSAQQQVRRIFVLLRRHQLERVTQLLRAPAPAGGEYAWGLAEALLSGLRGDSGRAAQLLAQLPPPANPGEAGLTTVVTYLLALPPGGADGSAYGHAVAAFRQGDWTGGVLSLQMLEFGHSGAGAAPELYLYPLLRRAFAHLAERALEDLPGSAADALRGAAHLHRGDAAAAVAAFRRAASADDPPGDAALLFSPLLGSREWRALVRLQAAAQGENPGLALTVLEQATVVARGSADGDGAVALEAVVSQLATTPAAVAAQSDSLDVAELYAARRAAVSRQLARHYWAAGKPAAALDAMEQGHRKASGYRPDFANPPAFLVELGQAYQRAGNYAPAVAVLFDLAAEYPSVRVAYESLKRLYASHTGGAVPPR